MDERNHRHNVAAARELRNRETWAEDLLWKELRGRRLDGLKFRRQHPVGLFVLDFCCVEQLLAMTEFRLLRFPNEDVRDRLPHVLAGIRAAALEAPPERPLGPGRTSGWD